MELIGWLVSLNSSLFTPSKYRDKYGFCPGITFLVYIKNHNKISLQNIRTLH